MEKPIIGIVSKNMIINDYYNWSWQRISDDDRFEIYKHGGIALGILPQTERQNFNKEDEHEDIKLSKQEIKDLLVVLKKCDGIILQGGISSHNYEEFIAKYCYDNDIPLIGICAGYNNIIRALGGKAVLITDVEKHNRPDLKYAHNCHIVDKNSLYYSLVKEDDFSVNSVHTYVGTKIPKKLSVVAYSDDNKVEVVEAKNKEFFIGIKYHPELLAPFDKKQDNIFKQFVKVCSYRHNKK